MLPTFSQNLTLQTAFENIVQINEELKRKEFDGAFGQKFKPLVNRFFHFLAKHRKSVEKMIHQKKNLGYWLSKIIKSRQSILSLCMVSCMMCRMNLHAQ